MQHLQSLRKKITQKKVIQAMGCHSPLSAKVAEKAGFDALWASGFELSAMYGLPDMSMITMTQHLDMLRAIASETQIPIIADIDTGYGNAINVIHTIISYEQAGASAVVMEDKHFPKVTSLLEGGRQHLLPIEEFQGKIEAACANRINPDFLIIARVEALIAGLGEAEALKRAMAYEAAGADLILIHSKQKSPQEIINFTNAWQGNIPLVIVPTAYPELTLAEIQALQKIAIVIYGNHAIRACTAAMQSTFQKILKQGMLSVEKDIASVKEIFELQNMDWVKVNEKQYLR
ncbi:isocitrate lyase/phosphoenolpyruvate mutase family protein [Aliikangiella maris]|uniref:Isocitrate lyase/phosphoenolpyruvate mutase family protein n=2 Tax=Aliikangiella maris TaxID=3162458 RepID=A0ABV2BUZ8_9GAMM